MIFFYLTLNSHAFNIDKVRVVGVHMKRVLLILSLASHPWGRVRLCLLQMPFLHQADVPLQLRQVLVVFFQSISVITTLCCYSFTNKTAISLVSVLLDENSGFWLISILAFVQIFGKTKNCQLTCMPWLGPQPFPWTASPFHCKQCNFGVWVRRLRGNLFGCGICGVSPSWRLWWGP